MRMAKGWFGTGLGPYRDRASTYDLFPAGSLPPLPEAASDREYSWLIRDLDPTIEYLAALDPPADMSGLPGLPEPFVSFLTRTELLAAVPSCTACWWERPHVPVASPLGDEARMLRFLNDQQGCLYWFLYLLPDGGHRVVAGEIPYDRPRYRDQVDAAEAAADLVLVAPTFHDFIYRFWVENLAWFEAVSQQRAWDDLSPEVQNYFAWYRAAATH